MNEKELEIALKKMYALTATASTLQAFAGAAINTRETLDAIESVLPYGPLTADFDHIRTAMLAVTKSCHLIVDKYVSDASDISQEIATKLGGSHE